MRFLLAFMLFFGVFTQVSGQGGIDTLGLTGTMADTAVADRLFAEMKELIVKRKWLDAEERGDFSLKIYERNFGDKSRQVADVFHQKGRIQHFTRKYTEAIQFYENSLLIRKKILHAFHPDIATLHYNLGLVYYDRAEYSRAIEEYNLSINIRLVALGANHLDLAWSYNNIANAYSELFDFDRSLEYHFKAKEIRDLKLGNSNPFSAQSHINIGFVYKKIGDFKNAIYHYEKAIDIFKTLKKYPSELSTALNNLGNLYFDIGLLDKSIFLIESSLYGRLVFFGDNHPEVAESYNNLGTVYRKIGNLQRAHECFDSSLAIRNRLFGAESKYVAQVSNNLGNLYSDLGEYNKAIEFFENSLKVLIPILGEGNPTIGIVQNNLGTAYAKIGNIEKSLDLFQRTETLILQYYGERSLQMADLNNNIGLTFTDRRDYKNDQFYYKKALYSLGYNDIKDMRFVTNLSVLITSLHRLSCSYSKQYEQAQRAIDLEASISYCYQALEALDYQQSTFTEESSKSFHLSQNYPIYEQAISVSLLKAGVDHNDTLRHNTFIYTEKSKAVLLQAQIKAADALAFAGIPDSLLEQEHKLRIDITWREKQRQSLLDKGLTETDTNVLRISGIVFDLKQQYETLKKRFETEYPDYYRLKYDLSTVPLAYVQDTLLQKDQALLEYFTGDSSLFLFVVRPDTFLVQEVKRDFPLEAWIDSLRFGLYGYYTTDKSQRTDSLREAALNSYIRYAQLLQQKLIAPVAAWLPGKVILVPDGPLGYIPFDALLSAEPEDRNNFKSYPYLLQKHQFSYTYSATLLREMRDKKHRREPQYDFAAFAPFYNGDTTLLAGMYAYDDLMRKDLQPLAFSGPEVAAAAKLMKGETIAGPAATEERFTSTAGNYRILHLATHGRADNRVGDYAFLAFNEIKDSIENELLYVKDLYNLQLNADLVVLSACETGIGKLQRGEGIISLARAFAYAGAKSIVTSLWSVNDKSTSELMRFFYRELRRGKDKDEALRLARQRLIREATVRNSHPFFWAAFVPLGDMRGVK